jgi:hypothetical protein
MVAVGAHTIDGDSPSPTYRLGIRARLLRQLACRLELVDDDLAVCVCADLKGLVNGDGRPGLAHEWSIVNVPLKIARSAAVEDVGRRSNIAPPDMSARQAGDGSNSSRVRPNLTVENPAVCKCDRRVRERYLENVVNHLAGTVPKSHVIRGDCCRSALDRGGPCC